MLRLAAYRPSLQYEKIRRKPAMKTLTKNEAPAPRTVERHTAPGVQTVQLQPGAAARLTDTRVAVSALQRYQQLAGASPQALQLKQGAAMRAGTSSAHALKSNDTGLPDQLKSGIESLSGMSMDHVKVHYNSSQPAQLNALAYAQGSEIHVGPGQEQHVPHEAWHVVQQAQGRVQPTVQAKSGVPVNDDAALEDEADVMGARAMAQPIAQRKDANTAASSTLPSAVMQMVDLNVKRVANNGNLFMGKSTPGAPALDYHGGTNWYGPKATASVYVGAGNLWRMAANKDLNLIDMASADSVAAAMDETISRRGGPGLSAGLQAALGNHDFSYAIPNDVAARAEAYVEYTRARLAGEETVWPQAHAGQIDIDGVFDDFGVEDPAMIDMAVSSLIQVFADAGSPNAVSLAAVEFRENPNNYRMIRKDETARDAGFADALFADLGNLPQLHGLHVPLGMKFGGWTHTMFECLIKNSQNHLAPPVEAAVDGPEADFAVADATITIDDAELPEAAAHLA
jgi:hypothetical protein